MVRIAVSVEAFEAISASMPFGSTGYERQLDASGQRLIWVESRIVAKLDALRGPGESYAT
jgi:hypothetical protein